jgi:putative aminopeptidase FrvX
MNPAGGFDTRNLFSRRVLVCADSGDYKGVMNPGGRPVHISSPKDREKVPEVKEFFVDIGLPGDQVKKKVKVGDYVVMDEPLIEVGNKFVSKALDNRVACWLGIESVRKLSTRRARATRARSSSRSRPRKKWASAAPRPRPTPSRPMSAWASTSPSPATRRACPARKR